MAATKAKCDDCGKQRVKFVFEIGKTRLCNACTRNRIRKLEAVAEAARAYLALGDITTWGVLKYALIALDAPPIDPTLHKD